VKLKVQLFFHNKGLAVFDDGENTNEVFSDDADAKKVQASKQYNGRDGGCPTKHAVTQHKLSKDEKKDIEKGSDEGEQRYSSKHVYQQR
jgi:hypothetical protein